MTKETKRGVFAFVEVHDDHVIATIQVSAYFKIEWWRVCGILIGYTPTADGTHYTCRLKRLYEHNGNETINAIVTKLKEASCYSSEGCVPADKPTNLKVERIVNEFLPEWGTAMKLFAEKYRNLGYDVQWDLSRQNFMLDKEGSIVPNDPLAIWVR